MKIVEDCWSMIETSNCQYGAHLFDGDMAKVYVNHWLDVDDQLRGGFSRRNEEGFVGHCLLVFRGVKRFDLIVTQYSREGDNIIWHDPICFNYSGSPCGDTTQYYCEGSLQGFSSSVSISIEAGKFELHILGKDEPAQEG